jgi:hypothetical protein
MLRRALVVLAALCVSLMNVSPASAGLFGPRGARSVDSKFEVKRTVVAYEKGEGEFPPEAEYLLIETEKGLALLERDTKKGGGILFEEQWLDDAGDLHFGAVLQAGRSSGWEFVIPADRSKPAMRHYYAKLTGCRSTKVRGILTNCQDKKTSSGTLIPKATSALE